MRFVGAKLARVMTPVSLVTRVQVCDVRIVSPRGMDVVKERPASKIRFDYADITSRRLQPRM